MYLDVSGGVISSETHKMSDAKTRTHLGLTRTTKKFDVTADELRGALRSVSTYVKAVEAELKSGREIQP